MPWQPGVGTAEDVRAFNMKDPEIRWLGDLTRVQPQPGDVFVLQVARMLSAEQRVYLLRQWKQTALGSHELVLIDGGGTLGIVGAAQPK